MAERDSSVQGAITFWAVIGGAVLAFVIGVLGSDAAPGPLAGRLGLVALVVLVVTWGIALLSLGDAASRGFMAGTLRKSTYTQIYTKLTRRLVARIWGALCDEPRDPKEQGPDETPVPKLFRHALTCRLYDKALLIAVAYPILLPVGQWVVTGEAARIGAFEFVPPAPFWWDRAAMVGAIAMILIGLVGRKMASHGHNRLTKFAGNFLLPVFAMSAIFLIFLLASENELASILTVVLMIVTTVFSRIAYTLDGEGAFAIILVVAVGMAWINTPAGFTALMLSFGIAWLHDRSLWMTAQWLATLAVLCGLVAVAGTLNFSEVPADARTVLVFLAVLPLLNAIFDTLSYAVTLTLMRRGLRSPAPWLWGLLDLALACLLFLALGSTLVVVIHGLNLLAGVPLIDLPALFAGIHESPGDYVWLYLMLFSTILPTVLHAGLSLLGVQGLWPRAGRGGWWRAGSTRHSAARCAYSGRGWRWASSGRCR